MSDTSTPASTYRNALYFTNWYRRSPGGPLPAGVSQLTWARGIYGADFQPQQIPASNVSHVLYAFADIASDGHL